MRAREAEREKDDLRGELTEGAGRMGMGGGVMKSEENGEDGGMEGSLKALVLARG